MCGSHAGGARHLSTLDRAGVNVVRLTGGARGERRGSPGQLDGGLPLPLASPTEHGRGWGGHSAGDGPAGSGHFRSRRGQRTARDGVPLPPGAAVAPERERGHSDGRRQGRKAAAVLEGHGPGGAPARMAVRGRVSGVWGKARGELGKRGAGSGDGDVRVPCGWGPSLIHAGPGGVNAVRLTGGARGERRGPPGQLDGGLPLPLASPTEQGRGRGGHSAGDGPAGSGHLRSRRGQRTARGGVPLPPGAAVAP
nr:collagen alpha-2(I) chain-like [Aegilops tauschii subsp. strangulata]